MDDETWLARLYHEHKRLLLLVAINIVTDVEEAEDVVHGALVKLAALQQVPQNPKVYAVRTTRNLAIDALRKSKRRREVPLLETTLLGSETTERPETDRVDAETLHHVLSGLERSDQELLRLHLQAGMTFREIAEATERPLPTVASRYRRALLKLRQGIAHETERRQPE